MRRGPTIVERLVLSAVVLLALPTVHASAHSALEAALSGAGDSRSGGQSSGERFSGSQAQPSRGNSKGSLAGLGAAGGVGGAAVASDNAGNGSFYARTFLGFGLGRWAEPDGPNGTLRLDGPTVGVSGSIGVIYGGRFALHVDVGSGVLVPFRARLGDAPATSFRGSSEWITVGLGATAHLRRTVPLFFTGGLGFAKDFVQTPIEHGSSHGGLSGYLGVGYERRHRDRPHLRYVFLARLLYLRVHDTSVLTVISPDVSVGVLFR